MNTESIHLDTNYVNDLKIRSVRYARSIGMPASVEDISLKDIKEDYSYQLKVCLERFSFPKDITDNKPFDFIKEKCALIERNKNAFQDEELSIQWEMVKNQQGVQFINMWKLQHMQDPIIEIKNLDGEKVGRLRFKRGKNIGYQVFKPLVMQSLPEIISGKGPVRLVFNLQSSKSDYSESKPTYFSIDINEAGDIFKMGYSEILHCNGFTGIDLVTSLFAKEKWNEEHLGNQPVFMQPMKGVRLALPLTLQQLVEIFIREIESFGIPIEVLKSSLVEKGADALRGYNSLNFEELGLLPDKDKELKELLSRRNVILGYEGEF